MTDFNLSLVIKAVDQATAPIRGIAKQIAGLGVAGLGGAAGLGRVTSATKGVGMAMGNVTRQAGSLGLKLGVLAGIGGGILKTQLVDTASQFERFRTVLETLEGSSEGASASMRWIQDFTRTTPFQLEEVTKAFVRMKAFGLDPTTGLLRTLGDTSSAMAVPLIQSVEAIADAMTGEYERLKEFGIKASSLQGQVTFRYRNAAGEEAAKTVDATSSAAIEAALSAIWNEKYAGSMKKLSGTWEGMLSNLADMWAEFKLNVMDQGLFDWLKTGLGGLLDTINRMAANGELAVWAKRTGAAMMTGMKESWSALKALGSVLKQVGGTLVWLKDRIGGWKVVMAAAAAVMAGPLILAIASLGKALVVLGAALLATPIGQFMALVGVIAGAAGMITGAWNPLKQFFPDLWAGIVDTVGKGVFDTVEYLNRVPAGVADMVIGVEAAITGAWDVMMGTIRQTFIDLEAWLLSIDLSAIAAKIVDSLIAGFRERWKALVAWLKEAVASLTGWLPDWAQGKLGVGSVPGTVPAVPPAPAPVLGAPTTKLGAPAATIGGSEPPRVDGEVRVTVDVEDHRSRVTKVESSGAAVAEAGYTGQMMAMP